MKDPYVYDGTNILINIPNIKDQDDLDEYESSNFKLAFLKMQSENLKIEDTTDIFKIHKSLFERVYAWAGEARTINIQKSEYVLEGLSVEYGECKSIDKDIKILNKEFNNIKNVKSKQEKIKKIARFISKLWKIHAFREGNTRTIGIFLFFWMKDLGLKLNNKFIGDNAKFFRNALVLASIGEYSDYSYLEKILLDAATTLDTTDSDNKYKSINGYDLKEYKYNYHHIK